MVKYCPYLFFPAISVIFEVSALRFSNITKKIRDTFCSHLRFSTTYATNKKAHGYS